MAEIPEGGEAGAQQKNELAQKSAAKWATDNNLKEDLR